MEAVNRAPEIQHQVEKKLHRAPSPARPKAIRGWSVAKSKCNPGSKPGLGISPCRLSRHSPTLKDIKLGKMPATKAAAVTVKKPEKGGGAGTKGSVPGKRKKGQRAASGTPPAPGKRLAPATDSSSSSSSSSELSDCPSEQLSGILSPGANEPRDGCPTPPDPGTWAGQGQREEDGGSSASGQSDGASGAKSPSMESRLHVSNSLAFSDFSEEFVDSIQEEFLKEIEELRSENDYLK
eukprot:g34572.t1